MIVGARLALAAGTALLVVLTGCADSRSPMTDPTVPNDPPTATAGPLYLPPDDAQTEAERTGGAAGRLVQCRTRITGAFPPDDYEGGETGKTPTEGFQAGLDEGAFDGPQKGYLLERTKGERVLFTYRVDGRVKMAVIMREGPALGAPSGWHMEAWARCDVSEFPHGVLGGRGLQIWRDESGQTVPSYEVSSSKGPSHCNWQSATFLHVLGEDNAYVRNPPGDLLDDHFDEDWRRAAPLPADAYDSGFHLGDDHLWFSPDRHRAYVGQVGADRVEMWPRTSQQLGCA